MPNYKINTKKGLDDSGYESGYESDGETQYYPKKLLGKGGFAQARLFKSHSNKEVTVLNPITKPVDIEEARNKHRFFQTVYPDKQSHLFAMEKDYRLVVPYIPYKSYTNLNVDTPEFQKNLFRSAIQVLKECHDKGIIVLDLKSENIYYDLSTQKSYLIDGGSSVPIDTPVDPCAFQKESQKMVDQNRNNEDYAHIPPECWSVAPINVLATPQMDIYALGDLMCDVLQNPDPEIQSWIDRCLEEDPNKRPTLDELLIFLDSYDTIKDKDETESIGLNF